MENTIIPSELTKIGHNVTVITAHEDHYPSATNIKWADVSEIRVIRLRSKLQLLVSRLLRLRVVRLAIQFLNLMDEEFFWAIYAYRYISRLITTNRPDVIYISMAPNSHGLIGCWIKKKFGIPWIARFQDPWAESAIPGWPTYLHYLAARFTENRYISSADAVSVLTEGDFRDRVEVAPYSYRKKFEMIRHGIDGDILTQSLCKGKKTIDTFSITHVGTFYYPWDYGIGGVKKVLKRLARAFVYDRYKVDRLTHTPYYLIKALEIVYQRRPDIAQRISLIFVGNLAKQDVDRLETIGFRKRVKHITRIPYDQVHGVLEKSSLLFLPMMTPKNTRKYFYWNPGKTYDYVACGVPILACIPRGDLRYFIEETGNTLFADATNPADIATKIIAYIEAGDDALNGGRNYAFLLDHTWERQAERTSQLIERVLDSSRNVL